MKNKIIIKTAKNNEPYVIVKAKNNESIATTETYRSLRGAQKAADNLKKIIQNSEIVDKTKKNKK